MSILTELIDPELLKADTPDPRYVGSIFSEIKPLPARQKGSRMEQIVACVYGRLGYQVQNAGSSDYDRVINGARCEIKGATLVKNQHLFSFLQIRPNQEYDLLIFAMFYPDDLVIMEMTKQRALELIADKTFSKQHGGNSAESGTYCYYGTPDTLALLGAKRLENLNGC